MLRCESPVVVFRAEPGEARPYATEPRATRLADGRILVGHRRATGRMSPDGVVQFLVSEDDRASWQRLPDYGPWIPQESSPVAAMPSGTLVATFTTFDRSGRYQSWFNPATEGRAPMTLESTVSNDGGRSWSPPRPIDVSPLRQPLAQSLCVLPSGEVLATFETFKEFDDPGRWRYQAALVRSQDRGLTWHDPVIAAQVTDDGLMWWDPRLALLADGRLVQFYRGFHHPTSTDMGVFVNWSTDDGRTWSAPEPTGLEGQTSWPISLPNGLLLLVIQRRPVGFVVALSKDGGRTFVESQVAYEHPEPSPGPADGSQNASEYFFDMERFTFGSPSGLAIDDNRALVIFFAGDRATTSVVCVPVTVS